MTEPGLPINRMPSRRPIGARSSRPNGKLAEGRLRFLVALEALAFAQLSQGHGRDATYPVRL
jgi:hypothetical protein